MSNMRRISCFIDNRRLLDTDAKDGVIEIKCPKCKNIVQINLKDDRQSCLKLNISIGTSN